MTTTRDTRNGNTLRIIETAPETFRLELWVPAEGRTVLGVARVVSGTKALRKTATEMAKS